MVRNVRDPDPASHNANPADVLADIPDDGNIRRQLSIYVGALLKKLLARHAAEQQKPLAVVLRRHLEATLFGPLRSADPRDDPELILAWLREQLSRRPWAA